MDYEVIKVLNNNVVLARHNNEEVILISKGIGFGRKHGEKINAESQKIEKIFHQFNNQDSSRYLESLPQFNDEVVGVSEEIIAKAETLLGPLSPNIHLALVDHLTFTLDRIHMDLPIENPFIDEITLLYEEEYDVAELASSLLRDRLGVDIGEEEKGFIALHLNSARNYKNVRETIKATRLFREIVKLITEVTGQAPDYKSDGYQAFVRSIKAIMHHVRHDNDMHNPLTDEIKLKMKDSYEIAKEISVFLEKEKNVKLSEDMIAYITIDIEKIRQLRRNEI